MIVRRDNASVPAAIAEIQVAPIDCCCISRTIGGIQTHATAAFTMTWPDCSDELELTRGQKAHMAPAAIETLPTVYNAAARGGLLHDRL